MFNLFCKLFIKNYADKKDIAVREKFGVAFSIFAIVCNITMVVIKLVVSIISNSVSIRADAFNNLSDCGSNIATLFGFKLANKHADSDHPYGHGRMEYVSGMIVSFLILLVAFEALKESIMKIIKPQILVFSYVTVIVLIFSIVVKFIMAYMYKKSGDYIESETLLAASQDSINDVVMTSATLICLLIFKYFNLNIDAYVAFATSLFVLKSGFDIFKDVLDTVLGKAPDKKLIKEISDTICSHKNILGTHDLILHDYGPSQQFMSLHVEVDASVPIIETHDLIDNIELEILHKYHILTTIHMDPVDTSDELTIELKPKVKAIIKGINNVYDIHDFRLVRGKTHTNLVFDVLIPADDDIDQEELKKEIDKRIKEINIEYRTVIQIDKSFC